MLQTRTSLLTGVNNYVPAMAYAHELIGSAPGYFLLGFPAASDDDLIATAIDSDAVAGTAEFYSWTSDSAFGRTLILTPSGNPGNSYAIDVYGWDYLGQLVIERFTGASGSTAILYGKKAFYRMWKTVVVTAASNAITSKLGTGTRLGLPFKGDVVYTKEAGVVVPTYKRDQIFYVDRAAAEAVSGNSRWIRAPFPGFVKTLIGTPNGGGGATDPVITVELGGVAVTGLTVTVDTSDVTGLTVTDTPTTVGYNANNRFVTNGLIEIVAAAAAGAFGDRLGVELTPTQVILPDTTDPATNVTGDPRGTYDPLTPPASTKVEVWMIGDATVNASNNGGLHGIRHFAG